MVSPFDKSSIQAIDDCLTNKSVDRDRLLNIRSTLVEARKSIDVNDDRHLPLSRRSSSLPYDRLDLRKNLSATPFQSAFSKIFDLSTHKHPLLQAPTTPLALNRSDSISRSTKLVIKGMIHPLPFTFSDTDLTSHEASIGLPSDHADVFPPEVRKELIKALADRTYDCIYLDYITDGRALSCLLSFHIAEDELIKTLKLSQFKCNNLARSIENAYLGNAYHNCQNACRVLHMVIHLIKDSEILFTIQDEFQRAVVALSACLAAAAEDIRHPGVSNRFLISTDSVIAHTYNDRSPLENYHVSQLFMLLKPSQNDIMSDLSPNMRRYSRNIIIEMILATDMELHTEKLETFRHQESLDDQERMLSSLQIILKLADLFHCCFDWESHLDCIHRLQQELFQQGDIERSRSLPISNFCDRFDCKRTVHQTQQGFFSLVVLPMLESFNEHFPRVRPYLDGANSINQRWRGYQHQEQTRCDVPDAGSLADVEVFSTSAT